VNIRLDQPLRRRSTHLLIGFSQALLFEELHGFANVTLDLLEGTLALHDSGAALLAELFNLICCDDHLFSLQNVVKPVGAVAGQKSAK
jgi:hypothetical protein